ncbi:prepilin peptidase [Helicobacter canadensis]|uniref:Type 4 prepilin peptidase n=1 Tax=Helicobacter canadensis MIT 98-5491 TaxID=537970 RepID=C5ZXG5_9HELI|nr:A24 family peptidase [Helicobacter canadensis]EES89833.1 type 4 prepilin peptidase [Helicobacter canadensis MIT 98-5491]EFR48632.1 bacterial peptidase A24, N-terminal domain protein [Helicobacter canadensis MIT 98-5491]STO99875.1 type IV prepilin peptidase HopD [Helicobacter canadensis]
MEIVFIFIIGAIFGSFANVLIFRIPQNMSIILPFSFCPRCKKSLGFMDKIPMVSYLILGGKCRYCGEKIPKWYLLGEVLGGIFGVFSFYCFGNLGIVGFFLFLFFYVLSVIDWRFLEIPDCLNFLNLALAVCFGGFLGESFFIENLLIESCLNALLFMGIASFLRLFVGSLLQKEVMGEGDIIVFGTLGASLGVVFGGLSIVIGSCYALVWILLSKKSMLPFVPFLFLGFCSAVLLRYVL